MKRTYTYLETAICTANVTEEFQTWKQRRYKNAMFRATLNYMHRVEVVFFFVAASRNADMTLHLAEVEQQSKFAVEGDRLHNMITHACVPDEFVEQILNANDTGQKLYGDYHVTVRTNGNSSRWAKVTKVGYKMFMSGNKTTPIKLREKTVDLKETKDLYGRLIILAKSETLIKKVPLEIMNLL